MKSDMKTYAIEGVSGGGGGSISFEKEVEKRLLEKKESDPFPKRDPMRAFLSHRKTIRLTFSHRPRSISFSRLVSASWGRKNEAIRDIDLALQRIREGKFGECEECGESISRARLKVIPTTELCVSCQEEEEKKATARANNECESPFPHGFARLGLGLWYSRLVPKRHLTTNTFTHGRYAMTKTNLYPLNEIDVRAQALPPRAGSMAFTLYAGLFLAAFLVLLASSCASHPENRQQERLYLPELGPQQTWMSR